jgi:hypothetical protein
MTNSFQVGHLTTLSVLRLWNVSYRMIDECEYDDGLIIGRGNRNNVRKPALMPLCPPQIPHSLSWDRTRGAAVVDSV